jgi:hypothetical protein
MEWWEGLVCEKCKKPLERDQPRLLLYPGEWTGDRAAGLPQPDKAWHSGCFGSANAPA